MINVLNPFLDILLAIDKYFNDIYAHTFYTSIRIQQNF